MLREESSQMLLVWGRIRREGKTLVIVLETEVRIRSSTTTAVSQPDFPLGQPCLITLLLKNIESNSCSHIRHSTSLPSE